MKNFKKVVAAGLALLMLALSVNVSFAADDYTAKEAEAVGKVNAAGIMTGTDKGFEPTKSLTRAEAAAIFVRMKGISEDTVKQNAGTTLFTDVAASHWAAGYINVASNYGIIKGVGANKFAPEKEVTVAEFYTMAIRSLNAGQLVEAEGTWPTNYVNFAIENDLAENVAQIYTATSTRLTAAIIVANTLEAPIWNKTAYVNNGEITFTPGDKTTLDVLGLTEAEGGITPGYVNAKDHVIDGKDVVETFDLSGIKAGIKYHAYINKDNEITGLWIEDDAVEFTKIAKEYDADDKVITLTVDGKDREYKLSADTIKTIPNEKAANGVLITTLDTEAEVEDLFGSITLNSKNEIVTMSTYSFTNYLIVDELTKSTVKFDSSVNGKDYPATNVRFDNEDNDYTLTKDGKAMEFADLEEGDAIRYYKVEDFDGKEDHDKYVAEVITPVTGKVTAKGADYIKIDGTKYKTVVETTTPSEKNLAAGIKLNDEIDAYLNNAGKVVMYKVVEEDKENSAAIVTYKKSYSSKYDNEFGNYDVKLTFMDGTESDTLSIDYDGIYKELKNKLSTIADGATSVTLGSDTYNLKDTDGTTAYAITDGDSLNSKDKEAIGKAYAEAKLTIGELVSYKINNGELVIVPDTTDDFEKLTSATKINVEKKSTYVLYNTNKKAYITKDTVIYNVVENKTNDWDVKAVNVDDLDGETTIAATSVVFVVGRDDKTNEVDYVIIKNVDEDTKFKRTTETNFAFIKEVSETEYEDKEAYEVTFIMLDGSEETYVYCEDEADADYDFTQSSVLRTVVDLEVKDGLVMKVTDATTTAANDKLIVRSGLTNYVKDVLNDRLILNTDEDIFLGEEVLVIRLKADGKFKAVKELTDIEEWDSLAGTDQDTVKAIYTYQDEDGETELVAVYYIDADDID